METRSTTSKKATMEKKRQSRKSKINAADTTKRSLHHLAKEDHNDDNASFSTILLQYPEMLYHIVGFMPFDTARKFLGSTSKFIRDHFQHKCEKSITSLELTSAKAVKKTLCIKRRPNVTRIGRRLKLQNSLTKNLISLDVGRHGSDKMLKCLRTSECTSTLKVLKMVGSCTEKLTDVGLWYVGGPSYETPMMESTMVTSPEGLYFSHSAFLTPHRLRQLPSCHYHYQSPFQALEEIDITFCSKTTYRGTFFLRDGLPNLKYLRRLPDWLCGTIHVPSSGEIRTHWMDGTCSFPMDVNFEAFMNNTWNSTIQDCVQGRCDRSLASTSVIFNQNAMPMAPGRERNLCGRRIATVLHLTEEVDPEDTDGRTSNYLLFAHNMSGSTRREVSLIKQVKDVVAVGESKIMYYVKNEPLVETMPSFLWHTRVEISKDKISPLPPHDMMPPRHIVEKYRRFCETRVAQLLMNTHSGNEEPV